MIDLTDEELTERGLPDEIIAAEAIAFRSRPIRWKRSTGDFVDSHCGFWHITPIYGGLTRPERYELWFGAGDRRRVGGGQTQRECGELFKRAMATVEELPREERTYQVEVRVNGVELDFNDFTDKVSEQFEELVMNAARRILYGQFMSRFHVIRDAIYDAEVHAKDLRNALEAEARKAWGLSPRQDEDDE